MIDILERIYGQKQIKRIRFQQVSLFQLETNQLKKHNGQRIDVTPF